MGKLVKYNIIGDIHGRTNWKKVVKDDAVNVFVGDYFDHYPHEGIKTPAEVLDNFRELMEYGKTHSCVFLYGNHDLLEYIWGSERCGRRARYANDIIALFDEYRDMFYGIAYSIGNKCLVTHAGVSDEWFKYHCEHKEVYGVKKDDTPEVDIPRTPDTVADAINKLYHDSVRGDEFSLAYNRSRMSDYYGESVTNSPLWYRSLPYHSVFGDNSEYIQAYGHTQHGFVATINMREDGSDKDYSGIHSKFVDVDCLGYCSDSFVLEIEE